MKFKKIISILLGLTIIITMITACKKTNKGGSSSDSNSNADSSYSSENSSLSESKISSENVTSNNSGKESTISKPINDSKVSSNQSTTSLSKDQVLAEIPQKLKNSTINFLCYADLKNSSYGGAIASFEKKTGIKFKTILATKDNYYQELASKISSGKAPDMFLSTYNHVGYLKNLQPITATGYNFNDTAWDKDLMNAFTFNGKTYGFGVKSSPFKNFGVIYYNKRALKKADMADPYTLWKSNHNAWTWNKLWSMCNDFLKANSNREGYYGMTMESPTCFADCFNASFYNYDIAKGKWVSKIRDNSVVKTYETLIDAVNKKWSAASSNTAAFKMGKILFDFSFSSYTEKANGTFDDMKENLGIVPVPTDSTNIPNIEYCAFSIPVGAKNAMSVPYLIRYVFDASNYDMNIFYLNAECKNVMDYSINKGNFSNGLGWTYDIWSNLISGNAADVRSTLDSFAGSIDDAANEANKEMLKLQK